MYCVRANGALQQKKKKKKKKKKQWRKQDAKQLGAEGAKR